MRFSGRRREDQGHGRRFDRDTALSREYMCISVSYLCVLTSQYFAKLYMNSTNWLVSVPD